MTRDYKKDFLKYVDEQKETDVNIQKSLKEDKKLGQQKLKQVLTKEFSKEIKDALKVIKSKVKKGIEVEANMDKRGAYFSVKKEDDFGRVGFNSIWLKTGLGRIWLWSNLNILERLNDLGDMEDATDVWFPQQRGQEELKKKDIQEVKDQFIRGMYEIAKEFI